MSVGTVPRPMTGSSSKATAPIPSSPPGLTSLNHFLRDRRVAIGAVDQVLSRVFDLVFAFPVLLLVLLLATLLGPGLATATLALVIVYVPVLARLVRAAVIAESERE